MKKTIYKSLFTALAALLFTACSQDEVMTENTPDTGSLRVIEVTLPEGGMQSRVATENGGNATANNLIYNQAFVGFESGDEIAVTYRFNESGADSKATLSYNGTAWSLSVTDARPNTGESWKHFAMTATLALSENEFTETMPEGVLNPTNLTPVRMYIDKLVAGTKSGGITADTDLASPTLGSFSIALKHTHAMLRLPKDSIKFENLFVVGQEFTPVLKTLWAELSYSTDSKMYIPFTEVGNNYQAIVPVEENGAAITLTGFQVVYTAGEDNYTHDINLGEGAVALAANIRYPLSLTLTPRKAEVTLTAPGGKPGWDENETIYNDFLNEGLLEVVYTPGTEGAAGTFTVIGPNGLQLVNRWIVGRLDEAAYTLLASSPYNWPSEVNARLDQNITLAADITLPTEGITVTDGRPSDSNWWPLGFSFNPYTGTINGNGKTITGLRMTGDTDPHYIGFVGKLTGHIKDLTLSDAVVYSPHTAYVGALVGEGDTAPDLSCTVSNCTVSGSVRSKSYVGGIIGETGSNCFVMGCTMNGSVVSEKNAGGIVGYNYGYVICCRNFATVTGAMCGGIVARNGGGVFGSLTIDTMEKDEHCTEISDKDGIGYFDVLLMTNVVASYSFVDASVVTSEDISAMNAAISATVSPQDPDTPLDCNWRWKAGTDGNWPTPVKTAPKDFECEEFYSYDE